VTKTAGGRRFRYADPARHHRRFPERSGPRQAPARTGRAVDRAGPVRLRGREARMGRRRV